MNKGITITMRSSDGFKEIMERTYRLDDSVTPDDFAETAKVFAEDSLAYAKESGDPFPPLKGRFNGSNIPEGFGDSGRVE